MICGINGTMGLTKEGIYIIPFEFLGA
jgi:hypothetical protein